MRSENKKFTAQIEQTRKFLIGVETLGLFIISLVVSVVRLETDFTYTLLQYPGQPKIIFYPLMWYLFLQQSNAWDRSILYFTDELYIRPLNASLKSLVAFAAISYLLKYPMSRMWVIINILASILFLLSIRFLCRKLLHKKFPRISELAYIYIGYEHHKDAHLLEFLSLYGFTPQLIQMDPPTNDQNEIWLKKYEETVENQSISGCIIGYGQIQDATLLRRLADTKRQEVIDLILISRISSLVKRFDIQDNPNIVRIRESQIVASGAVLKRIVDVSISTLALILLAPIFFLVALFVKLTSKGSVFYVDKRIGLNGVLFSFPKFRSMYSGANVQRLDTLGRPDEDMLSRYKNDPRITPFGRFIRRWSIDEIPQFWCVLIGTMSIVGPRPILQEELDQVENHDLIRFVAKPGLTGLWQVTGRKEVSWNDRMLRDISYVDDWSLTKDLILIAQTVKAIIKGTGAH